jgi:hypothetical protein
VPAVLDVADPELGPAGLWSPPGVASLRWRLRLPRPPPRSVMAAVQARLWSLDAALASVIAGDDAGGGGGSGSSFGGAEAPLDVPPPPRVRVLSQSQRYIIAGAGREYVVAVVLPPAEGEVCAALAVVSWLAAEDDGGGSGGGRGAGEGVCQWGLAGLVLRAARTSLRITGGGGGAGDDDDASATAAADAAATAAWVEEAVCSNCAVDAGSGGRGGCDDDDGAGGGGGGGGGSGNRFVRVSAWRGAEPVPCAACGRPTVVPASCVDTRARPPPLLSASPARSGTSVSRVLDAAAIDDVGIAWTFDGDDFDDVQAVDDFLALGGSGGGGGGGGAPTAGGAAVDADAGGAAPGDASAGAMGSAEAVPRGLKRGVCVCVSASACVRTHAVRVRLGV